MYFSSHILFAKLILMKNPEIAFEVINDKSLIKSQCHINGEWVDSLDNTFIAVRNPYNNNELIKVPSLNIQQVDNAIEAAHKSFMSWKCLLAIERSNILRRWYELIIANVEDLGKIMVLEQGKPLKEAIGEIKYAASYIEFYAEESKRINGDILQSPFPGTRVFITKQPVGVVGIITPWNFPAAMMARKIAPALASGCTCVVKPDEKTPLTAFALMELAVRAGIPNGVLNMVTGNPQAIGEAFTSSNLMRKISFTGSTEVGKLLMRNSSKTLKKITLELGGNAPFIVFHDANLDEAVSGLIDTKFRNAGQTCVCANRIFIHEEIIVEFSKKLIEKIKSFIIGNGLDNVDIGPLINLEAIEKIEVLINEAVQEGAKLELGGKRHSLGGLFFEPTVLLGITNKMKIFCTEIFGPIVTLISFSSVDQVIDLANDTRHGLASYFYSKDNTNIWKVADELQFGMVGVNSGIISSALIPFGGIKESGFGREGSKYGIEDYLNIKYILIKDS